MVVSFVFLYHSFFFTSMSEKHNKFASPNANKVKITVKDK
jgi:hypothetical protein